MNRITRKVILFLYGISVILCINSVCSSLNPAYTAVSEQPTVGVCEPSSDAVDSTSRISYSERFSTICYTTAIDHFANELRHSTGSTRIITGIRISHARLDLFAVSLSHHSLSVNRFFHTYNTNVLENRLACCKFDYRIMNSYFSDYI